MKKLAGGFAALVLAVPLVFVVLFAGAGSSGGCGVPAGSVGAVNGTPAVLALGGGWVQVGATLDPTYTGGAYQQFYNSGYSWAELGATPGYPNYVGGLVAKALGLPGGQYGLPGGFALLIRAVGSSSPGIRILKSDIGSGQAGDLHYAIDLHPAIAQAIGFNGKQDVQIKIAGSSPGVPPPAGGGAGAVFAGLSSACAAAMGPAPASLNGASPQQRAAIMAMLAMASALNGKPYVWGGGHGGWGIVAGYDCSGFVSAVLHAAGYLSAPQTTQTLPSQPGIDPGQGQFVSIYDRTNSSASSDHVIIDIAGQWWESGGVANLGVHPMVPPPDQAYLTSFDTLLHPQGL